MKDLNAQNFILTQVENTTLLDKIIILYNKEQKKNGLTAIKQRLNRICKISFFDAVVCYCFLFFIALRLYINAITLAIAVSSAKSASPMQTVVAPVGILL